jgi:toxin-antitoxin system PIN domain toxin
VIVPDINLLLYAEIDAYPVHGDARRWWEALLNGNAAVGLPPACLFGFLRISTNRRVFAEPLAIDDALSRVRRWLEQPNVTRLVPGSEHLDIAFRLLAELGTGGNLTTDVQIAAHALEHQAEVHSNDGDFARFEGLRWVNPLAPPRGSRR